MGEQLRLPDTTFLQVEQVDEGRTCTSARRLDLRPGGHHEEAPATSGGAWASGGFAHGGSPAAVSGEQRSGSHAGPPDGLTGNFGGIESTAIAPRTTRRPPAPRREADLLRTAGSSAPSPATYTSSTPSTRPCASTGMKPSEFAGRPIVRGPSRRGPVMAASAGIDRPSSSTTRPPSTSTAWASVWSSTPRSPSSARTRPAASAPKMSSGPCSGVTKASVAPVTPSFASRQAVSNASS